MGYLSKEAYERKTEWAHRHQAEQKAITMLTEEQHDFLSDVCSMRHEIHCNQDSLFNCESANYSRYWSWIDELADSATSIGLPHISIPDFICLPNDHYWNDDEIIDDDGCVYEASLEFDTDRYWEKLEIAQGMVSDYAEKLNNAIEDWLSAIDRKHGTQYCPRGESRLY